MKKRLLKRKFTTLVISCGLLWGGGIQDAFSQPQSNSQLISKNARILVDKAHPAHGRLVESDFEQIADAGFNVVVTRWAKDLEGQDIDIEGYANQASKSGLAVMKWDYGLIDGVDDKDRTVNRLGKPTRYAAPFSESTKKKLTERVLQYVRLSLTQKNLKGLLLDYEIYDRPNKTDGFCESYDDDTFSDFFHSIGRDIPRPLPLPEERKTYLEKRQMYQLYVGYQIDLMAKMYRQLRHQVDEINPYFQFGIYGWGAMVPPIIHELATPEAPALNLNALTYGRSIYSNAFEGGYDGKRSDIEGLQWSLDVVKKGIAGTHQRYDNVIFLAGHYPQSPGPKDGTQFKFTAKQAFQSAAFGEGYWIWTDWFTPKPWTDRREWWDAMLQYFKEAHIALDAGDLEWAKKQPDTVK